MGEGETMGSVMAAISGGHSGGEMAEDNKETRYIISSGSSGGAPGQERTGGEVDWMEPPYGRAQSCVGPSKILNYIARDSPEHLLGSQGRLITDIQKRTELRKGWSREVFPDASCNLLTLCVRCRMGSTVCALDTSDPAKG